MILLWRMFASLHGDAESQFKGKIIQLMVPGVGTITVKNARAERKTFHQHQQILHHNARFKISFFHGFEFHPIMTFGVFQPAEANILTEHNFRIIGFAFSQFSKTMSEKQRNKGAGKKFIGFHGGKLFLAIKTKIDVVNKEIWKK